MIINNNELDLSMLKTLKKAKNLTVGLTSGCFDLFHNMHLTYLEKCKSQCDILIVGVDADLLVHENKKHYPQTSEYNRLRLVHALKCVDVAFQMNALKDLTDMYSIADKLFKNSDVIYGSKIEVDNLELVIIPDVIDPSSTTDLITKIQNEK